MRKNFLQSSIRDSLFTGLVSLALFGPIVGLRTVAENEILVVHPKWLIVAMIVVACTVGRFFINLYTFRKEQRLGIESGIGKSVSNFLDNKGYQIALGAIIFSVVFPFKLINSLFKSNKFESELIILSLCFDIFGCSHIKLISKLFIK